MCFSAFVMITRWYNVVIFIKNNTIIIRKNVLGRLNFACYDNNCFAEFKENSQMVAELKSNKEDDIEKSIQQINDYSKEFDKLNEEQHCSLILQRMKNFTDLGRQKKVFGIFEVQLSIFIRQIKKLQFRFLFRALVMVWFLQLKVLPFFLILFTEVIFTQLQITILITFL